jgi:hypothetical protein
MAVDMPRRVTGLALPPVVRRRSNRQHRAPQFHVLALELRQALAVVRCEAWPRPAIDFGVADPEA